MYPSRRNQAFASPISTLPVELLSEIFSLCVLSADEPTTTAEDEEYSTPVITTETVRVPFTLSSVNRRWRTVVLGQSSLWSNLCITAELIGDPVPLDDETDQKWFTSTSSQRTSRLNTKQIISCLQRSRQASLNIFIDARDPEWNFAEAGVGIDFGDTFTPEALFSPEYISAIISLLIPHLSRWKSLTILTDTWAPMHAALAAVNPHITAFGAPRLESMTLMRCNDFVSFSPQFQPSDLKEPRFLSRSSGSAVTSSSLLPSLKHLSLRGVHVDWDSLGDALASSASLASLELTSHCADVRPSLPQFHKLLSSTPSLRTFVVTGSGLEIPDELDEVPRARDYGADLDPVRLPHLKSIDIGYRTALEGRMVLKLLDAPSAKMLVLEDATYPGDPEEVNGSTLLNFLGSKEFYGNGTGSSDEKALRVDENKQASVTRCRKSSASSQREEPSSSRAAFPLLEKVTLKSVKSSSRPLRTFFDALPHLQHLELVGMSMQAVHALIPTPVPSASESASCPCPQLRSICIRDSEKLQVPDLDFIVGDLATEREARGACGLREVDIHVDAAKAACVAAAASPGTRVKLISDGEDDDVDDMDMDEDMDPYKLGGAFNDPLFDDYYSEQITAR